MESSITLQSPCGCRQLLPLVWPEIRPIGNALQGAGLPVAALLVDLGPPPRKSFHPAWINEPKEDDDDAERQARVEGRAQRHGVLGPPSIGAVLDLVVEDVAHQGPDGEVEACGRRDPAQRPEEDRQVDLADDAVLLVAPVEPERDGRDSANQETPHQRAVSRSGTEELGGADHAPEDGTVEVDAGYRASEAVDGLGRADAGNVCEHPVEDRNLGERGHNRCHHLDFEEDPRWDFHVMPKLQIRGKLDALSRRDVAVGHEHHIRNGPSGKDKACDELTDKVDATVLVRHCHYYADGDKEYGADSQS